MTINTPAPIGADAAVAQLRHLYRNLTEGGVRDTAQAKRIADGLLAPAIAALERATLANAAQPADTITASEAVFAFAAWLTCRDEAVTLGGAHDAAGVAELAGAFVVSQGLAWPRDDSLQRLRPYPAAAPKAPSCTHRIADARNPIVRAGYICVDCGALFAAADHDAAAHKAASAEPSTVGDTLAIKAFQQFGVGPHTVTPYLDVDKPEGIRGYRFLCDALAMAFEAGRVPHGKAPAPTAVPSPSNEEIDADVKQWWGDMRGAPLLAHRAFIRTILAKWGVTTQASPAAQGDAPGWIRHGHTFGGKPRLALEIDPSDFYGITDAIHHTLEQLDEHEDPDASPLDQKRSRRLRQALMAAWLREHPQEAALAAKEGAQRG